MILKYIKDILLFLLILSFFNDNFIVEIAGASSLKIIFMLFFISHIPEIISNTFKANPHIVIKSFFIFITLFAFIMLINFMFYSNSILSTDGLPSVMLQSREIFDEKSVLINGIINFLSIFVIFIYFSYYQNITKLLYFLWLAVVISAVISLFNDPISEYTFRTTGGTADPNRFAMHILIASMATIYLYIKNKNLFFLISSFALFSYALLYAGSKTSIIVILFLVFYIITIKFGFILKRIFSFKGFIAFLILIGISSQMNLSNSIVVKGMQDRLKERTDKYRIASWKAGMGIIRDNFLIGVGEDNYEKYTRKYAKQYMDSGSLSPHNIMIKLFAENGVFVFVAFIIFLFLLFKSNYTEIKNSDYFWISLIPLIATLTGLTLNFVYEQHFWFNYALLMNIILITNNKKEIV